MYEIFLTSVVASADFERANAVLQGLCAMSAWKSTHRVLYFSGPPKPRGLALPDDRKRSQFGRQWVELSQYLSRSSFVVQARYDLSKDKDFGSSTG